ncbi:MAG: hypothetical protein QOK17_139 [Sphingomonadales bacterium]|nr:hypothetical protein [Sphingomonadales bacterium]
MRRCRPLGGLAAILVGAAGSDSELGERLLWQRFVHRRWGRGLVARGEAVYDVRGRFLVAGPGEDRAQQDEYEHEREAREADADTLHAGRFSTPLARGI